MAGFGELAETLGLEWILAAGVLVLGRVVPLVLLLPFLGGPSVPRAIRFVVAAAVAVAIFPAATADLSGEGAPPILLLLTLKEIVVGVSLGLVGALAFHALGMAGQLIDVVRGASMSMALDPTTGEERSPLASLYFQLGVVLFIALGGHRAFLAALAGSYEILPLGDLPSAPAGLRAVAFLAVETSAAALAAAVLIAAPAVSAIVLADLALGILGRTAPQVGTYFMAMPLRAATGVAMTLLTLAVLAPELGPFLETSVDAFGRAAEALSGSH